MEKGVTVAQVARVARNFTQAGIMVHAYLMYGFPTETAAETLDSLERVRQLFAAGVIQSAFWHRFTLTRHSPIAQSPDAYGVTILGPRRGPFANNDLEHADPSGADPDRFADGLRKALYNYMHGLGLTDDVRAWFPKENLARSRVPRTLVARALEDDDDLVRTDPRLAWIGGRAQLVANGLEVVTTSGQPLVVRVRRPVAVALLDLLRDVTPSDRARDRGYPRKSEVRAGWPGGAGAFDRLLQQSAWASLGQAGLLGLP
jgi:hypothetical protein